MADKPYKMHFWRTAEAIAEEIREAIDTAYKQGREDERKHIASQLNVSERTEHD